MSGETFPTVLWFKSYSKNSRALTVLWDTLGYLRYFDWTMIEYQPMAYNKVFE